MPTVNRSASIVTVTCVSTAEMENKLSSLRQQLAKLPALQSGKKRSFSRKGLVLEVPTPVWNELIALNAREEVTRQLVTEITGPVETTEEEVPDNYYQEEAEAQDLAEAERIYSESVNQIPNASWTKEQLQLECLERGIRYSKSATKAKLLTLLLA